MQKRTKKPNRRTQSTPNSIANRKQAHADGWQNIATGLGTSADKRTAGALALDIVSDREARDLWRGNDLAKRIIEDRTVEALRSGFVIKMDDKETAEEIMTELESIPGPMHIGKGLRAAVIKARQYENAYGGAAIFPVTNDSAGSLAKELRTEAIGRIERFQVFEPRQLRPAKYYKEPTQPKFGEPETYHIMPIGTAKGVTEEWVEIHESRLVLFPGIRVTGEYLSGVYEGWGDNVLSPVRSVLNDFELSFGGAAHLLQDFGQAVLKLDRLGEILALDDGTAQNRLRETNKWRSTLRALVLDTNDSFERVTTPLTGYSEILDRLMFRLAAAARMPVSRLMGMAPAGLNATGEADRAFWYDSVKGEQEYLKPMIEHLIRLYMLSSESSTAGKEPDVWSIEFAALWQPSDKEVAEARSIQANTDKIYIEAQVVSPEEIALARFGGDTYSFETTIDFEARNEADPVVPIPVDAQPEPEPAPISGMPGAPESGEGGPIPSEGESPEETPGEESDDENE